MVRKTVSHAPLFYLIRFIEKSPGGSCQWGRGLEGAIGGVHLKMAGAFSEGREVMNWEWVKCWPTCWPWCMWGVGEWVDPTREVVSSGENSVSAEVGGRWRVPVGRWFVRPQDLWGYQMVKEQVTRKEMERTRTRVRERGVVCIWASDHRWRW